MVRLGTCDNPASEGLSTSYTSEVSSKPECCARKLAAEAFRQRRFEEAVRDVQCQSLDGFIDRSVCC